MVGLTRVRLQNDIVVAIRVHARTLPEGVLQLLDQIAHEVGGAKRALWEIS